MEIFCQSCKARLKIRDDKLPDDKAVQIKCPKCNSDISVNTNTPKDQPEASHEVSNNGSPFDLDPKESSLSEPSAEIQTVEMSMDEFVDFLEEGLQRALICDNDQSNQALLKVTLKELGYWSSIGKDPGDALEKMRFTHYDLVVLNDGFGGLSLSENPVLNYIQTMPIATRRNIFVSLIGPQFRTYDNMTALSESANLVINQKDMPNIMTILKSSISENERFYAVFHEILDSAGRA